MSASATCPRMRWRVDGMIRRMLLLLLLAQGVGALALAAALMHWGRWPWRGALAAGLGVALLVRLAISVNNFRLSRRAGGPAPAGHGLSWGGALAMLRYEFVSSMLTSSWRMLRPVGLQLAPGAAGLPVLLVHGYACNSGYWRALSGRLRREGVSHLGIDLEPPGAGIDEFVPQLQAGIERLCAATGSARVIIVAHSMGGLVARAWQARSGAHPVARIITLGSPHGGTALAQFGPGRNAAQMRRGSAWLAELAAIEANLQRDGQENIVSSIYSVHDNIVAPQDSACLPGARNLAFGGIGHVALGRHPAILRCVLEEIAGARRDV